MNKVKAIIIIYICLTITALFSLEISNEQTWYRHRRYEPGSQIHQNQLFVNALTGLEVYNILQNGNLELAYIKDFNKYIKDFVIVDSTDMIYFYLQSTHNSDYYIEAYLITESELVSVNIPNLYPSSDYGNIASWRDGVIFPYNLSWIYIDANDQSIQTFDNLEGYIVGAVEDLVFTNQYLAADNTLQLNVYAYDETSDTLEYSDTFFDPNPDRNFGLIHPLNDNRFIASKGNKLKIFEYNESNEISWLFDLDFPDYYLFNASSLADNCVYFAGNFNNNLIIDFSDIQNPIILSEWYEDVPYRAHSVWEDKWLYKSCAQDGIYRFDIEDKTAPSGGLYQTTNPGYSANYIDGYAYYTQNDTIKRTNVNTNYTESICQTAFAPNIPTAYYRYENLLYVWDCFSGNAFLMVIDLNTSEMLYQTASGNSIVSIFDDLCFIKNNANLEIYRITQDSFSLIAEIELSSYQTLLPRVTKFDEDSFWLSHHGEVSLISLEDFSIIHDYGNLFSTDPSSSYEFTKYSDRLIVRSVVPSEEEYIFRLYDIADLGNPVLLDSYFPSVPCAFYYHDDKIIEETIDGHLSFYHTFDSSFSEPFYETDITTIGAYLTFDPENSILAATSYYYLKTFYFDGETIAEGILPEAVSSTLTNYPNPFRPATAGSRSASTTINYTLPQAGEAEIIIYNLKGQKIKTLFSEQQLAGEHSVLWNGRNDQGQAVASGVYLYQLQVDGQSLARQKMMLVK